MIFSYVKDEKGNARVPFFYRLRTFYSSTRIPLTVH